MVLPVWRSPMISSRCAANGDHGVDGLDAGLQRLLDRLTVDDAGSAAFNGAELGGLDGACAVDGLAQRVDHAADHGFAHRHGHHLAGALDSAAFLDTDVGAQQNDGDGILLQILGHAVFAVIKLKQLTCHALFQTTARAMPSPTIMTVPVSLCSMAFS